MQNCRYTVGQSGAQPNLYAYGSNVQIKEKLDVKYLALYNN